MTFYIKEVIREVIEKDAPTPQIKTIGSATSKTAAEKALIERVKAWRERDPRNSATKHKDQDSATGFTYIYRHKGHYRGNVTASLKPPPDITPAL